jgi:hypothetical protein
MNWWFLPDRLADRGGIEQLFKRLEQVLPEAIPIRWDVVEPPSHRLQDEGIAGLVQFLDRNRDEQPWMWTSSPVVGVQLDVHSEGLRTIPRQGAAQGVQTHGFHLELLASLLEQPGWPRHLPKVFKAISEVVRPFYAEARIWPDPANPTDFTGHPRFRPVDSPTWRGMPHDPPIAFAIGSPYLEVWPEAAEGYRNHDVVVHASENWPEPPERLPVSPTNIRQEFDPHRTSIHGPNAIPRRLPEIWPFP